MKNKLMLTEKWVLNDVAKVEPLGLKFKIREDCLDEFAEDKEIYEQLVKLTRFKEYIENIKTNLLTSEFFQHNTERLNQQMQNCHTEIEITIKLVKYE